VEARTEDGFLSASWRTWGNSFLIRRRAEKSVPLIAAVRRFQDEARYHLRRNTSRRRINRIRIDVEIDES